MDRDMSKNEQFENILVEVSKTGYETGSEDYYRALAEAAIKAAGFEFAPLERRSLLYERIDAALANSKGLVLCDTDCMDYICHALSLPERAERFALVLPIHDRVRHYDFKTRETVEVDEIALRGHAHCALEDWNGFESSISEFANLVKHCLEGTSDRFLGLLADESKLPEMAAGFSVSQVRVTDGRRSTHAPFDPITELQESDKVWTAVESLDDNRVNIVIWESDEVNGIGYDIGYMKESLDPYNLPLHADHLKEVIKLPAEYECQLFVWESTYDGQVRLSVVKEDGTEDTSMVFAAELERNYNYSPEHYLKHPVPVSAVELGSLCKKIQRGTSLKGKDLKITGDVRDKRWIVEGPGKYMFPEGGTGPWGIYSAYELYYVDNASIVSNEPGSSVIARILEEIPPGQERYTLTPDDGTVILMPRNGKGEACYFAESPTLVSNNLFIIWPDPERIDPEYLVIAMRSKMVAQQMRTKRMPLGKAELSKLLIPMASEDEMQSVVDRNKEIHAEISAINSKLEDLRKEDPLDLLWDSNPEAGKPE